MAEEDVIVPGPVALPASLTYPRENGTFPAVILIAGSGPQDRDATIGPNKPFRDIAWSLASRKILVLRFDKRTHEPKHLVRVDTVEDEVLVDTQAAVDYLSKHPRVDKGSIVVLGHSLGGMLVPRLAQTCSTLKAGVIVAANSRPIEAVLLDQLRYLASLDGTMDESEKATIASVKDFVIRVRERRLPSSGSFFGAPHSWWIDLHDYDPVATALTLPIPLFVVSGGRDYQVPEEDWRRWEQLRTKPSVTLRRYPALNHLMMRGEGPSIPSEYDNPGEVDGQLIADIADWILEVTKKK